MSEIEDEFPQVFRPGWKKTPCIECGYPFFSRYVPSGDDVDSEGECSNVDCGMRY